MVPETVSGRRIRKGKKDSRGFTAPDLVRWLCRELTCHVRGQETHSQARNSAQEKAEMFQSDMARLG